LITSPGFTKRWATSTIVSNLNWSILVASFRTAVFQENERSINNLNLLLYSNFRALLLSTNNS